MHRPVHFSRARAHRLFAPIQTPWRLFGRPRSRSTALSVRAFGGAPKIMLLAITVLIVALLILDELDDTHRRP
jgi:hypothetical protein